MGSKAGGRTGGGGPVGDHPRAVEAALDEFQEALGDRYLEMMYDQCRENSPRGIPGPAHLEGATPELWDHTSEAAREHLNSNFCKFLSWFAGGGRGDGFQSVVCDSYIPPDAATRANNTSGFTCGVGQLFVAAIEWAWKDREYIFERIPPFATQDINALKTTRDAYLNAAKTFGLDYSGIGRWDVDGEFRLGGFSGTIKDMMEGAFLPTGASSASWMVGWTGAAADAAATGFFHTTEPTLSNHAKIADALAYLVNLRATIIDRNRINTLDLIDLATAALGEMRDVDLTGRWAVVQGIGSGLSLTGVGAVIGAPMTYVGWLGEKLYPKKEDAAYASEPYEVAAGLAADFDDMTKAIDVVETEYRSDTAQVENAIGGAPLEALELYDITQNNPEGTAGKGGDFDVNIDEITRLAAQCYAIGEAYEEIRAQLRDLYDADPHMTDRDGDQTEGDKKVMSMREDLLNFVNTTIGRYSLMGSQLEDAARAYAENDDSAARSFDMWEESMDESHEGPPVSQSEAEALAEATDRNSTGPQSESNDESNIVYDPEGWDHPEPTAPEKQEG